ncbi:hypothetical protein HDU82_004198 [Entophlyctis luteolus]|nr:hypothetical protein HDU82_004198 [Entophlyctis luteolus]
MAHHETITSTCKRLLTHFALGKFCPAEDTTQWSDIKFLANQFHHIREIEPPSCLSESLKELYEAYIDNESPIYFDPERNARWARLLSKTLRAASDFTLQLSKSQMKAATAAPEDRFPYDKKSTLPHRVSSVTLCEESMDEDFSKVFTKTLKHCSSKEITCLDQCANVRISDAIVKIKQILGLKKSDGDSETEKISPDDFAVELEALADFMAGNSKKLIAESYAQTVNEGVQLVNHCAESTECCPLGSPIELDMDLIRAIDGSLKLEWDVASLGSRKTVGKEPPDNFPSHFNDDQRIMYIANAASFVQETYKSIREVFQSSMQEIANLIKDAQKKNSKYANTRNEFATFRCEMECWKEREILRLQSFSDVISQMKTDSHRIMRSYCSNKILRNSLIKDCSRIADGIRGFQADCEEVHIAIQKKKEKLKVSWARELQKIMSEQSFLKDYEEWLAQICAEDAEDAIADIEKIGQQHAESVPSEAWRQQRPSAADERIFCAGEAYDATDNRQQLVGEIAVVLAMDAEAPALLALTAAAIVALQAICLPFVYALPAATSLTTATATTSLLPASGATTSVFNETLELIERKKIADEADKTINHLKPGEFKDQKVVLPGDWLLFFGSVKCPHCQKLTPEFLKYQDRKQEEYKKLNLRMAKVECTELSDVCTQLEPSLKWYPTLRIYKDGVFHEEYDGEDDIKLIEEFVDKYIVSVHGEAAKAVKKAQEIAAGGTTVDSNSSEQNPTGTSIPITSKNIEQLLSDSVWIVKFFSPVCHHCKVFAPTWLEVAKELKGKMNAGEIDCTIELKLCQRFGIMQYPTVQIIKSGKTAQIYKKIERTTELLVEFALRSSVPAFAVIRAADVKKIYNTDPGLSMFYFYDEKTPLEFVKNFAAVASQVNHIVPINVCPEPEEVIGMFSTNNKQPANYPIFVVSQGEKEHKENRFFNAKLELKTENSQKNLKNWILKHSKLILQKLEDSSSSKIMDGTNVVVLGIMKTTDDITGPINLLKAASKQWIGFGSDDDVSLVPGDRDRQKNVVFAWIDVNAKSDYVNKAFDMDLKTSTFPQLVIVDTRVDVFYDVGADGQKFKLESAEKILGYVDDVFDGKLKSKSAYGVMSSFKPIYRMSKPFAVS